MRRILVLRGGALGDFIVTLPALAALRARWPAARIELIGNAAAAALARARGVIDAAHSQHEGRWRALFDDAPLPAELEAWLAEFDLVLNYWPDPDGELRRRFPVRHEQIFLSAPAMPVGAPAAAHYCAPLRELGLEPREFFFSLAAPAAARREFIAVHPGSGSPKKNWPLENWHALLETLPAPTSVILGEAEAPRWSAWPSTRFQAARPPPAQPIEGDALLIQRPLEELVAHFARCRLFLGHDSGISHLAAACGVPCVLLFGPTDPARWAPPAPHVRILHRGPDLSAIPPAEVQAAVAAALREKVTQ